MSDTVKRGRGRPRTKPEGPDLRSVSFDRAQQAIEATEDPEIVLAREALADVRKRRAAELEKLDSEVSSLDQLTVAGSERASALKAARETLCRAFQLEENRARYHLARHVVRAEKAALAERFATDQLTEQDLAKLEWDQIDPVKRVLYIELGKKLRRAPHDEELRDERARYHEACVAAKAEGAIRQRGSACNKAAVCVARVNEFILANRTVPTAPEIEALFPEPKPVEQIEFERCQSLKRADGTLSLKDLVAAKSLD